VNFFLTCWNRLLFQDKLGLSSSKPRSDETNLLVHYGPVASFWCDEFLSVGLYLTRSSCGPKVSTRAFSTPLMNPDTQFERHPGGRALQYLTNLENASRCFVLSPRPNNILFNPFHPELHHLIQPCFFNSTSPTHAQHKQKALKTFSFRFLTLY